jgi:hypothetical protein
MVTISFQLKPAHGIGRSAATHQCEQTRGGSTGHKQGAWHTVIAAEPPNVEPVDENLPSKLNKKKPPGGTKIEE